LKNFERPPTIPLVMDRLCLWIDEDTRDGASNMAVDEWLLESADKPVLRIYGWEPGWGSYGYFVPDTEAAESLKGLKRVRRWTGGGIVDHRRDWTYSLVIPRGGGLAEMRGAESYRVIHSALAEALRAGGVDCRVAGSRPVTAGGECFRKAVKFDLLDGRGDKIAGAGQRRTARGLLHQGSLALETDGGLGIRLAELLAKSVSESVVVPVRARLESILSKRYTTDEWRSRR
jgi:lipoate-protein ligase A